MRASKLVEAVLRGTSVTDLVEKSGDKVKLNNRVDERELYELIKTAPIGATIQTSEGKPWFRLTSENRWLWYNSATGKPIQERNGSYMFSDADGVFTPVRNAIMGNPGRKVPAWPSTGYGELPVASEEFIFVS